MTTAIGGGFLSYTKKTHNSLIYHHSDVKIDPGRGDAQADSTRFLACRCPAPQGGL